MGYFKFNKNKKKKKKNQGKRVSEPIMVDKHQICQHYLGALEIKVVIAVLSSLVNYITHAVCSNCMGPQLA